MAHSWGRFTARGGEAVEARITTLVRRAGEAIAAAISADAYHALVLIGGYGRGEGGIETRENGEHPHNNLDFLLIARDAGAAAHGNLQERLDACLAPLEAESGIGLDASVIPLAKLRSAPCLVMWYDMRFGHKTILGDAELVPSLRQFNLESIVPLDVLWLLINRGSQMAVNALLLSRSSQTEEERRCIIRWTVKSIIGYGDALLFFHDAYHWSYQEKQRRMRQLDQAPESFRALYDEAMEFRFQPRYPEYLARDLKAWMHELRDTFQTIHHRCESRRLGKSGWTWADYPGLSLRREAFQEGWTLRATAKKARNLLRSPAPPPGTTLLDGLALRMAGPRGMLAACYPVVLYALDEPSLRLWCRHALQAKSDSDDDLRIAFMRVWGHYSDPNFFKVAPKLGLPIEP